MFVILIHYTRPLSEIDAHLAAHRSFLDTHYQNGTLLMSGPANPRNKGVIISNHSSRADVEAMIQQDPFYQAQVADYEIIEFTAVKFAPSLAELIR